MPFTLSQNPTGCRGFSLIEMLLVVAILGILMAVLMSAMRLVKSSANRVLCASNLRQICSLMLVYAGDNRGGLPAGQWGADTGQYISWDDRLSSYDGRDIPLSSTDGLYQWNTHLRKDEVTNPTKLKAYAMYTCPSEEYRVRNLDLGAAGAWMRSYAFSSGGWSYAPKLARGVPPNASSIKGLYWCAETPDSGENYVGGNSPYAADWAARMSQISSPATTILLGELRHPYADLGGCWGVTIDFAGTQTAHYLRPNGCTYGNATGQINLSAEVAGGNVPLHRSTWNYLFADGHVENLTPDKTQTSAISSPPDAKSMWMRMK
jgi:prepilin-type N-terminal cleavage/methylation domain-containing protein/prepilin-type processing-associated H-X9-DG protein